MNYTFNYSYGDIVYRHFCVSKNKPCAWATRDGYCSVTCCCNKESEGGSMMMGSDWKYETIRLDNSSTNIAVICGICSKSFPVYDNYASSHICPECRRRLKKLLYKEENDD